MFPILNDEQMDAFQKALGTNRSRRGGGRTFAERLQQMDKNADGKVERSEVPDEAQQLFDRLDTNGDGVLDEKEIAAAGNRRGRGL